MGRKLRGLVAGSAILAALSAGLGACAQPRGYGHGLGQYAYRYDPPKAYGADGRYTGEAWGNGYDGYNLDAEAFVAAHGLGVVPHDEYGPDPNGMTAPDGRRIKCKLASRYDEAARRYRTRRECW